MTIKRHLAAVAFAVLLVAGVPAFAQQIATDYDHSVNFSRYHTYSWRKVQTTDPLFVDRIKSEVDKDLNAKGLREVPQGGDIALTAVGGTHNQQEYNTFYDGLGGMGFGWRRGWGGGGFGDSYTTVEQIPVGTLVVDFWDPQQHKLVWRGTSTDTLSDKPEKNTAKLDKAIDKMLDKFPPKGAAEGM
jgi:hypothetical protein